MKISEKKPHIAILTDSLEVYGGKEKVIVDYAEILSSKYQVFTGSIFKSGINSKLHEDLERKGSSLHNLHAFDSVRSSISYRLSFSGYKFISKWFRFNRIEFCICMSIRTFIRCCFPAFQSGVKLIYAHHLGFPLVSGRFSKIKHFVTIALLKWKACSVLVLSSSALKQFEKLGIKKEKMVLCSNGFDFNVIQSKKLSESEKIKLKENWGLAGTYPLLGIFARLDPIKNIPLVLKALSQLIKQFPEIHLVVFGEESPEYPRYKSELIKMAQILGISERVKLMGWCEEVPQAMSCCDIILLTSRMEQLPSSLIEAMCVGVPVIATDVGGVSDIVIDGKTGLLIPEGDEKALIEVIITLCNDSLMREKIIEQACVHIQEKFSFEQMRDSLLKMVKGSLL